MKRIEQVLGRALLEFSCKQSPEGIRTYLHIYHKLQEEDHEKMEAQFTAARLEALDRLLNHIKEMYYKDLRTEGRNFDYEKFLESALRVAVYAYAEADGARAVGHKWEEVLLAYIDKLLTPEDGARKRRFSVVG